MTDNIKPTVQEKSAWAKVPQEFNDWWNGDYSDESNPFRLNSAAYWAWAGWSEAVRLNAQAQQPLTDEKDALDLLNAENTRLMKLVIELRAEVVRLNAQAVPDGWKLVPVQATPDMCKASVIYANGNAVYKNVAHEALEIEESIYSEVYDAMLSAAPAAPQPAQQPTGEKDALLRQALEALEGFANITNDSQGVKGYHLNGDIAEWDEFDEVDAANSTIEAIRNHLGVKP